MKVQSILFCAAVASIGCLAHADSERDIVAHESRNGYLSRRRHHLPVYGDKASRKRRQFSYTYPTFTNTNNGISNPGSTNPFANTGTTGTNPFSSTNNPYATNFNPTTNTVNTNTVTNQFTNTPTTNNGVIGTTGTIGTTTVGTQPVSAVSVSGDQDSAVPRPAVSVSDGASVNPGGVLPGNVGGMMEQAVGSVSTPADTTATSNRLSDVQSALIKEYLTSNERALLAPGSSVGVRDLVAPCGVQMRMDKDLTINIDNTTIFSAGAQELCPNKCKMTMKYDGELVMYALHRGGKQEMVWSAETQGEGAYGVLFPDGNFVVLSMDGAVLFKSTSSPPSTNDACVLREKTITSRILP